MAAKVEHREGDKGVGVTKPKAIRVISRTLVLTDSMRPLDGPCSIVARIEWRCRTILRCSVTNAGIRQRRAKPIHRLRAATVSS